jgi:hypothetical protein
MDLHLLAVIACWILLVISIIAAVRDLLGDGPISGLILPCIGIVVSILGILWLK